MRMTEAEIYCAWDGAACPCSLQMFTAIIRSTEARSQERIAALEAENHILREKFLAGERIAAQALAEREALRKDAERYNWLRDKSVPPHNFYLSVPVEFDGVKYGQAEVDAYIDAAIAAQKGEVKS